MLFRSRHIVKYLLPASITGDSTFEGILTNPIDFGALDRPENSLRIRLNSTAIDVSHDGPAETADHVNVTYYRDGKISRVRAKAVVVSTGAVGRTSGRARGWGSGRGGTSGGGGGENGR